MLTSRRIVPATSIGRSGASLHAEGRLEARGRRRLTGRAVTTRPPTSPPPPANDGEDPRDHRKPEPDTDKYFDNLAEEDEPDQNASIFDFGRDL